MKKFLALALLLPSLAFAQPDLVPSHVQNLVLAATSNFLKMTIDPLMWAATTVDHPWARALPSQPGNLSVYEIQGTTSPVTRAVPTLATVGAISGLALNNPQLPANQSGMAGIAVTVCSATGTTLSGAGTVEFYVYDPALPEWSYWKTGSQSVTATTQCQTFDGIWIPVARGQVIAAASGVTFSSGSGGVGVYMVVR